MAPTGYNEAYNIARRIATRDHLSGGRGGWNVATTADLGSSPHVGREAVTHLAERSARSSAQLNAGPLTRATMSGGGSPPLPPNRPDPVEHHRKGR
jgi:alkanesulfonate monooxygenase SsuD/methylene tetrahydromethanopterin reductase-like flavin-dependent oxidoreductase (luciferase family)